jgi:hypothetical protein
MTAGSLKVGAVSGVGKTTGAAELRRFRPYPAYKDSGVEWLGKIPAAWGLKPLNVSQSPAGRDTPEGEC